MHTNTCLVYSNANEVYQNLIKYCSSKKFKVIDTHENFYYVRARRTSILLWKNLRMELEILATGKDQVQVKVMLYRLRLRQRKLESKYIVDIENYLNNVGSTS